MPSVPMFHKLRITEPISRLTNGKRARYKGGGSNKELWCKTTVDGTRWSDESTMGRSRTDSNPALAVHNSLLFAVFKGKDTTSLYCNVHDGNGWTGDSALPGHASAEGPAPAVFAGNLYCVHRGGSDRSLWCTRWSPYSLPTWSTDTKFPDHASLAGPAIVTYRDVNSTKDQLMCVHRGN
jgi:hypothetical protein